MPYKDPDKQRAAARVHLQRKKERNPQWYAELKRKIKAARLTKMDVVNSIKSSLGCLLCDECNHDKLQFHHVVPDLKSSTISGLISSRARLVTILKEIDKCVCVCSACHKNLGEQVEFTIGSIMNESWYQDWTLIEAMEWSMMHPQKRLKKSGFVKVVKAVIRNIQLQDIDLFNKKVKYKR